jgi:hypothetical protein
VNTTDRTATRRLRATFARALSCVLLVGITYAATVGSVHSHENLSSGHHTSVAQGATGQAAFSADLPLHSHTHNHECLICLLQQQLFHNALYKTPSTPTPPSTQQVFTPSATAVYSSASNTPRRGRAPPPASLL